MSFEFIIILGGIFWSSSPDSWFVMVSLWRDFSFHAWHNPLTILGLGFALLLKINTSFTSPYFVHRNWLFKCLFHCSVLSVRHSDYIVFLKEGNYQPTLTRMEFEVNQRERSQNIWCWKSENDPQPETLWSEIMTQRQCWRKTPF